MIFAEQLDDGSYWPPPQRYGPQEAVMAEQISAGEEAALLAFREHRSLHRVYADGVAAERARIVAWLRDEASIAGLDAGESATLAWAAGEIESWAADQLAEEP